MLEMSKQPPSPDCPVVTGRNAIRPYDSWPDDRWEISFTAVREDDHPVYLLDDGGLMAEFVGQHQVCRHLAPIEELRVPLCYAQDRETECPFRLESEP